ncbi:MAG: hypothetical protein QXK80_03675 [Candidatus Pacearchaeota archaeon]
MVIIVDNSTYTRHIKIARKRKKDNSYGLMFSIESSSCSDSCLKEFEFQNKIVVGCPVITITKTIERHKNKLYRVYVDKIKLMN